MIQVRYIDISALTESEYGKLYDRAFRSRQEKADRYLRMEDRHRCIIADALLRHALRRSIGTDQVELARTPDGKPYLPGREDFHFNLSHSGRWVAIAWSDRPVGIDVELLAMDEGKEQLARRFFRSDEQEYLFVAHGQSRAQRFFEIWTKKESYLKFQGTGINRPLNSFSVLQVPDVDFCTHFLEDAVLTLCAQGSECQIIPLSLDALFSE